MYENKLLICTVLCILIINLSQCYPQGDFVVSSTELPKEKQNGDGDKEPILPKIYDMKVVTNVTNRFATTNITSKVKNLDKAAQEATFSVVLPEKAFISGFTMEIDGKLYDAYIQEKEEAKKTYDTAVQAGIGAAHVAVSARDSNRFTVSVNIEPQSKAIFYLQYEELLQRQSEKYEIVLNIHPGQPIKDLQVEVNINETRPLKFVKAPSIRSGNEISKNNENLDPKAVININNNTATVKFNPDIDRQKEFAKGLGTKEENGLAGQFVVQYDVERDPQGGEVLLNDGFFVHFFAPEDVKPLPKHVVFVLDTSGSMDGIRISQLKDAMKSILSELQPEDKFNIVEFASVVKVWDIDNVKVAFQEGNDPWATPAENENKPALENGLPKAYNVNEETIKKANEVVKKLDANGGTDIQSALKVGIQMIQKNKNDKNQPIIIFLTDGEATVGEINNDKIISTVTELNSKVAPIFSLSFGNGADKNFLQKISLKNLGFARHIYEGADASLQLEEFYRQISSPLLKDIKFKYVSNVTDVTKVIYPIMFKGTEIIVAGKYNQDIIDPGYIETGTVNGPIKYRAEVKHTPSSLERLWAYITVKQFLEQRDAATNKTGPTQEALRIALKYKFVTDVTSLVVVKPNATNSAVNTEEASQKNFDRFGPSYSYAAVPLSGGGGAGVPGVAYFAPPHFAPSASAGYGQPLSLSSNQFTSFDGLDHDAVFESSVPNRVAPTNSSSVNKRDYLISKVPWLAKILNKQGILDTPNGPLDLGLTKVITTGTNCTNAPNEATGTCKSLFDCESVYSSLTKLSDFIQHSCTIEGITGVCCA